MKRETLALIALMGVACTRSPLPEESAARAATDEVVEGI
jgi:hypothetical protein